MLFSYVVCHLPCSFYQLIEGYGIYAFNSTTTCYKFLKTSLTFFVVYNFACLLYTYFIYNSLPLLVILRLQR